MLTWGEANARPLLFWHGFGPFNAGAIMLNEAGPAWAERGLFVIAPNAPGFGASPPLEPQEYTVRRMAELGTAVLDGLGLGRVSFVGFSWGARVGLRMPPDRLDALVLLDAGYRPWTDARGYEERVASYREQWPSWDSVEAFLEEAASFVRTSPGTEERLRAAVVEHDGRIVPRLTPEIAAGGFTAIANEPDEEEWPRLAASKLPVLLLGATLPADDEDARAADRQRFAEAVPQAEIRLVPDAGHDVLGDQSDVVIPLVADWLLEASL